MFPNLRAEMARKNINGKHLANALDISHDSVGNKMNGRTEFTRLEMFKIKKKFFSHLSVDYLFETENQEIA